MTPPLAPSADTRDVALRSESMAALATVLLDWRVDCERQLRALTSLQRWLERVRGCAADDGERDLLLQEMRRLLRESPPDLAEWTRQAEAHVNNLTR